MATLSVAARNAALDALVTLLNTGGSCVSRFAASGTILTGLITTTWGSASGGSVSASAPLTYTQSTNVGTANQLTLARPGFIEITATVGGPGSGADIELTPNASIISGIRVVLSSLTMSIA
jgi:hypothetical protein